MITIHLHVDLSGFLPLSPNYKTWSYVEFLPTQFIFSNGYWRVFYNSLLCDLLASLHHGTHLPKQWVAIISKNDYLTNTTFQWGVYILSTACKVSSSLTLLDFAHRQKYSVLFMSNGQGNFFEGIFEEIQIRKVLWNMNSE